MMWGWNHYDPWMWVWGTLMMFLFWGTVIGLAVWAVRALRSPGQESDSAMKALRQRLASGQINQEEYERTKKILQG